MSSRYPSLLEGSEFEGPEGDRLTVLEDVDTFGKPTHKLDAMAVDVRFDDGTVGSVALTHFGGRDPIYTRVMSA